MTISPMQQAQTDLVGHYAAKVDDVMATAKSTHDGQQASQRGPREEDADPAASTRECAHSTECEHADASWR